MLKYSNKKTTLLTLGVLAFLAKLWLFIYMLGFEVFIFSGGDADYYHDFVMSKSTEEPANIWPVFLMYLDSLGLYSREVVSYGIMSLSLIFIPTTLAILVWNITRSIIFTTFVYIYSIVYPTQIIYSFDIYRDVLMIFLFIVAVFALYSVHNARSHTKKLIIIFIFLVIACALTLLRPYLGASIVIAFFYLVSPHLENKFKWFTFLYITTISAMFYLNTFDLLLNYRERLSNVEAVTNLNLRMSGDGLFPFLYLLIQSFYFQVLGGYLAQAKLIVVFVTESIPALFSLYYIIRNSKYFDGLAFALIVFFIIYNTIWIIGNDNFATGMRLRVYSYYSLLICMAIVYKNKLRASICE